MKYDYELFVIGAGSGGVRAARISASLGARVGIAEERYLGGTCVNVGCVPKKLFVYGSHFSEDFHDATAYGWSVSKDSFDWDVLRNNKTREINRLNGIYRNLLEDAGVEIYDARARLIDEHTIKVNGRELTSEYILIATGSWPAIPQFPGSEHVISSNECFFLDTLPSSIVIVGGGYIAVEFAGIFAGLGVETTLLYRRELFLRGFDRQVREFVCEQLVAKGIDVQFNSVVDVIESHSSGFQVRLTNGKRIETGLVMYATGRLPLTNDLGLEQVNIKLAKNGAIIVDEKFCSSVPNILAIGDVIDRIQLTPVAIAEAMCVANNLFGADQRQMNYRDIPTAVFCQPNIGTVGPIEAEARVMYSELQVYESRFKPMKHTMTGRNEQTFMKLLVDGSNDRVIAAHMVGPEAGEIIQGLAVAIKAKATKKDFDRTIGIHPTAAEEFVTMREAVR